MKYYKRRRAADMQEVEANVLSRTEIEHAVMRIRDDRIRILPPTISIETHQCWKCGSRNILKPEKIEYGMVLVWCLDCGRTWHMHL